ncbi:MAG: hypothetical protein HQM10_20285 [Candidatus Riflebacteria bacterium]|nr:hypothetical protein [Candidatus Riflebacteria bacterium]
MWIALFDFCIFMLLFGFFLFGLREWDRLLIDPENDQSGDVRSKSNDKNTSLLWLLIFGLAVLSLISFLKDFIE